MALQRLWVHVDDLNNVITSRNSSKFPTSIPPYIDPFTRSLRLRDTQVLQWALRAFPFLPFVPSKIEFIGPLFGRLAYKYQTVPLEGMDGRWTLATELKAQWERLEDALYVTCARLMFDMPRRQETNFYSFPSDFGYRGFHETQEYARRAIMMSRDAFVPLMAHCSWVIAHQFNRSDRNELTSTRPAWVQKLVDKHRIHAQWVENLRLSTVGDFFIER